MTDLITEPDPTIRISEAERPDAIRRLATVAADVAEQLRRQYRSRERGPVARGKRRNGHRPRPYRMRRSTA